MIAAMRTCIGDWNEDLSHFSMGVHSAARVGANVAAPPLKFQLVAVPTSRIATVSSVSVEALVVWMEGLF